VVAAAIAQDVNDLWLVALWQEYFEGRFPAGELRPHRGVLREVVERARFDLSP
jgi:hypothetical protein